MRVFGNQQLHLKKDRRRVAFKRKALLKLSVLFLLVIVSSAGKCMPFKNKQTTATLLDTSDATKEELIGKIDRLAKFSSMRAKMYLTFEDNSFAKKGISEKYRAADGEIVVQRPSKILLKIKVPFFGSDVAQMTSDGVKFRVAILQDGGSGKLKKFLKGTNDIDYSRLQEKIDKLQNGGIKKLKKDINAFANIRPQHFTDAILVRATDKSKYIYLISTVLQEEIDQKMLKRKSPLGWVLRGYYLLDEFTNDVDGLMKITRRFWFDRVGGVNLSRQQIYNSSGEIASDIIYGKVGNLTKNGNYKMPLQVTLTRPLERYKVKLKYQSPKNVKIGKIFRDKVFELENRWDLEELDLDKKLEGLVNVKNQIQ